HLILLKRDGYGGYIKYIFFLQCTGTVCLEVEHNILDFDSLALGRRLKAFLPFFYVKIDLNQT
ncbi:MAG TPA: hypothetical protein PKW30_02975, partial [Campylobacterales bacterium]|nr:hypothetical protein [Campylobacterales bacterium]